MRDADDDDTTALVVDLVDDPPVSHANAVVVAASELRGAALPRLGCQALDRLVDPAQDVRSEPAVVPLGARLEEDLVAGFRFAYRRTSAQGRSAFSSRSARASNAARLSSRNSTRSRSSATSRSSSDDGF
jgi:hypothetical protein